MVPVSEAYRLDSETPWHEGRSLEGVRRGPHSQGRVQALPHAPPEHRMPAHLRVESNQLDRGSTSPPAE